MINIVIVGNCQARPIASILPLLNNNINITATAIVHLLTDKYEEQYIPFFDEADFIVTQQIADNYPCEFVRTNLLKSKYSNKIITIINLYYSGYNPDLMYIRDTSQGTLKSPLGEYHNKTIYEAWKAGKSVKDALSLYNDYDYNKNKYTNIARNSLLELKNREKNSDISITDFIEEEQKHQRLFFVFNHPSLSLLIEMVRKILTIMEIRISDIHASIINEPLDKIIAPINIYAKSNLKINFKDVSSFKGVDCFVNNGDIITTNAIKEYSFLEITENYYQIYDATYENIR